MMKDIIDACLARRQMDLVLKQMNQQAATDSNGDANIEALSVRPTRTRTPVVRIGFEPPP